jgi:hypothetical protein
MTSGTRIGSLARPEGRQRAAPGLPRVAARCLSALLIAAGVVLTLFHVWLFWERWQAGGLTEPLVALRWIGSALLVAALVVLRRRRGAVYRGRQALVVWTLVALVHVGANHPELSSSPLATPGVMFVVPSAAAAALLVVAAVVVAVRRRRVVRPFIPAACTRDSRRHHPYPPFLTSPQPLRAPPSFVTA